jgi:lysophospholipase L1-like esterase
MKLVCFGDSITARTEGNDCPILTLKLKEKLSSNWEVINGCVPGNNTFDALQRIEKDVLINLSMLIALKGTYRRSQKVPVRCLWD